MIKVSPSILAGDFGKLSKEAQRAEEAGADMLHIDVMDGHFVPNISLGPQAVAAIRKATKLPLDVHLMLSRPDQYIDAFIAAGSDIISVHVESQHTLEDTVKRLVANGVRAAVVFNPHTPFQLSRSILEKINMVLFMSVIPGFGGQKFMPEVLEKIRGARGLLKEYGIDIQVDGGINLENAPLAVSAGANVLVAGTSVYGSKDMKKTIEELKAMG